jgi:glycosyltransferase involved in cell wall biosynthesis
VSVRILVITDLYPPIAFGGCERTCATLVEALRDRHDFTVLTSDLRRDEAPEQSWVRRELPYLGPQRRAALRVPRAAVDAATATRRALRDAHPDLVYVWACVGISQAAPLVAAQSGVPIAYRFDELWAASALYSGDRFVGYLQGGHRGVRRLWSSLVRGLNRRPALRLDPSRPLPAAVSWCSDELRDRVTLPRAIHPVLERTSYPGVAHSFIAERQPSTDPTVAYAGRVTTAKGAELAVEAVARLREFHGINAQLVLAGDCQPKMARRIGRLAAKFGVTDRVRLLGALSSQELAHLFSRAHVVVVPTVTHEAFGRVCIEAALARVPVVAAHVGGIPEALREDEHALFFEPGDAAGCAEALAATLTDPGAARDRAERAVSRAQRFSVERFAAEQEAFLDDATALLKGAA